jgi:hypothetical protein
MTTGDPQVCPGCGYTAFYQLYDSESGQHTVCIQCGRTVTPSYIVECPTPYHEREPIFIPFNQPTSVVERLPRHWSWFIFAIGMGFLTLGIAIGHWWI